MSLPPNFALKVEILTLQLEEIGWDSVRGRAAMLRGMSRYYFGDLGNTYRLHRSLRRIILEVRTPREWAIRYVIWFEDFPNGLSSGLEFYLNG